MILFLGMGGLSPLMMFLAVLFLSGPAALLVFGGGALYLLGVMGVTGMCNVPMNQRLGALPTHGEEAANYWSSTYYPRWTFWNSVRTWASCLAALCFLMAIGWFSGK